MGRLLVFLFGAFSFPLFIQGQVIFLQNPSLEDLRPGPARLPLGWYSCGQLGESPPDLHPSGVFQVKMPPAQGKTYVGLVVRPNGSRESILQQLSPPLDSGVCYLFSLVAARSPHYLSFSPGTGMPMDYNQVARIRIWGGNTHCATPFLLATSLPVDASGWVRQDFLLCPPANCAYLRLEADFLSADSLPYAGHVLVDGLSPLIPVHCQAPLAAAERLPLFGNDEAEIRRFLGKTWRDLPSSGQWQKQLFLSPEGAWQFENQGLFLIQWLFKNSQARLPFRFRIVAEHARAGHLQRVVLGRALRERGIPPKAYRIKTAKQGSCPEPWICIRTGE